MAYATTDDVAAYLGITIDGSSTPNTTTVSAYLDEASAWIDHITKTTYSSTTETDVIIDYSSDTTVTSAVNFDATGALNIPATPDRVKLPHKDVISLVSVYFNSVGSTTTPSWVEQDIGYGQDVILVNDTLQLLQPTNWPLKDIGSIKATYTRGRSSVPDVVKSVCVYMASLQIMEGAQASSLTESGGSIRIGDIQISDPSGFSTSFIKFTRDSLDKRLKELGTHNTYLI